MVFPVLCLWQSLSVGMMDGIHWGEVWLEKCKTLLCKSRISNKKEFAWASWVLVIYRFESPSVHYHHQIKSKGCKACSVYAFFVIQPWSKSNENNWNRDVEAHIIDSLMLGTKFCEHLSEGIQRIKHMLLQKSEMFLIGELTHWPLGDFNKKLDMWFST